MKEVIDNFSNGASQYATFRPGSPQGIFDYLYAHLKGFDSAWDCGTGNGQVAIKLAERFRQVYGTDISKEQLALAIEKENITYLAERAEETTLADHSIDLITIAQAIHWFDLDNFYKEVRRVAKPGALIAGWTYSTVKINPDIDKVIDRLYTDITGAYWDKQRKLIDERYETIPFPFEELKTPPFTITLNWTLEQLAGYLRTWSGVKHYIAKEQKDPVQMIQHDLEKTWGGSNKIEMYWPVYARIGRIN